MKYLKISTLIAFIVFLSGCNTIPKDAFLLSESALKERQMQSRQYETNKDIELMAAGIGVLQDMGYTIEETEKDVGLVTASKRADATSGGQVALAIFAALLGAQSSAIDKEQKIRVSLVTSPAQNAPGNFLTRITFQRVIWNTQGKVTKADTINNPEIYKEFFDKLSKSVFLEAHQI